MANSFELTEHEVHRNRVLVAEQGRLSRPSTAQPEEDARQVARARTRDLEFAWASFLESAMRAGAIPQSDPRLLTLRDPRPLHQHLALVPPDTASSRSST